jgi:uncharacterized protein YidB (DUF937 family)
MDDLTKALGGMTGGASGGGGGDIAGALGSLVGGEGGLDSLLGQLKAGGLGDAADSWVATGPNQSVSPEQLGQALGPEKVQALAGQSGLDIGKFLPIVAAALPAIIDSITPDGKVPSGDAAQGFDIGGLLEGLSGAAQSGPDSPLAGLSSLLGGGGKPG